MARHRRLLHHGCKAWSPRHATQAKEAADRQERVIETAERQRGQRECLDGLEEWLAESEPSVAG